MSERCSTCARARAMTPESATASKRPGLPQSYDIAGARNSRPREAETRGRPKPPAPPFRGPKAKSLRAPEGGAGHTRGWTRGTGHGERRRGHPEAKAY
eukprot:2834368-Alexandrium_andersonii.AAC.1